jgi:predicted N-acyltransferase
MVQTIIRYWPLLVCRSPLSGTSGLILPDPPLREAALKTIVQVARDQAKQYGVSFLIFDYLTAGEVEGQVWPDGLGSTMVPDPGTHLPITWPDFDSYVRQLTKRMRKSYRRHCSHADKLGIVVTVHPQVVTPLDEAMTLIRNVEKRHNSAPNPWIKGMLQHAGMVNSTWLTAHIDSKLVGCELMLGDKGTRFLTALGLDYSVQYVYFRLGYEDIAYAIKDGVQVLRGGSGAYEVKHRLGFELENNNYVIFTPTKSILRWMRP